MDKSRITAAIWTWGTDKREQMVRAAKEVTEIGYRSFESVKSAIYAYDMDLTAYKEVLKKYCLGNSLEFDETAYDEFVKNIEDENLKDATGRIKNYCHIIGSINSEKFKLSLSEYISEDMEIYKLMESCILERG